VDLNGDGFNDILSGSYSRHSQPMAGLFQVLWGKSDKTFEPAEVLKGTDDEPLLIPLGAHKDAWIDCICTRPTAVDWDGDGKLDLITGNFTGTFYLFRGEGHGRFLPKGELIICGEEPLKIDGGEHPRAIRGHSGWVGHSDPFLIDWDRDGDLDLLSGSSAGGVQWAENEAGPGKPPQLKPFQTLIKANVEPESGKPLREADLTGPLTATRIWVDDMNSDGKLDILVGDTATLVSPAEGVSEEELAKRSAAWQREWIKTVKEVQSLDGDGDTAKKAEAQKRLQELYASRDSFMKEEMTGFVWLYLQK
jgi:hypothetical protein